MNFDQIKKKYPKAWDLYIKYLIKTTPGDPNERCCTKCDMFKFFREEHDLIITYNFRNYDKFYVFSIYPKFVYHGQYMSLNSSDEAEHTKNKNYEKAEQAAFTKAFEILEQKK